MCLYAYICHMQMRHNEDFKITMPQIYEVKNKKSHRCSSIYGTEVTECIVMSLKNYCGF